MITDTIPTIRSFIHIILCNCYRQERAYTMSMGGSASPWGSKKVEIRRPNPQEFYGPCGGLFMCEGSFFDIHEMQEEEGDNFSLERAFQKQWLKSSPLYRKMNGKW